MKIKNKFIYAIIFGLVSNFFFCFFLTSVFSFLFFKTGNFSEVYAEPLILIIIGIGSFLGGYVSGKIKRENGMFFGMVCGFLTFIFIFIGGLLSNFENITLLILIKFFLMLLAGAVGGIVGVNSKKR